ncbi:TrkA C-terminal domain-containing protein [Urinicoccus massiliensis]|uniref:TrkA C-terminal domain-containing protein n=1 Tax=Urinicoccus massiliensis TaxID=1723382 RepID=UPI00093190F2|nr:TrkA C-terminal domain-containing protein [Urinicoccus massiliensis]
MKFCVIGDNLIALDLVERLLTQEIEVYWLCQNKSWDYPKNKNLRVEEFSYQNLNHFGDMDYTLILGDNDEENILQAYFCKKQMDTYTIVLVQNHSLTKTNILETFDFVDEYLYPSENMADYIIHFSIEDQGLPRRKYLHPHLNIWAYTLEDRHPKIGQKVKDLFLDGTLIVAIYRKGDFLIPQGETVLRKGDRLFLLGNGSLEAFRRQDALDQDNSTGKAFWILGDSIYAKELALCLEDEGYECIVTIPRDQSLKAWRRALPKALVNQAKLTSLETFNQMDTKKILGVICASQDDNENVVMSLLAREVGLLKTICLLNYKDYAKATEKVVHGVQMIPRIAIASQVFSMVHLPGKIHITPLPGGTCELLELELLKDAPIIDKALKDMVLPDGVIIGAVLRHKQLIIPSGQLTFKKDDRLIILEKTSLREDLLNKIYRKDQQSMLKKWIGGSR